MAKNPAKDIELHPDAWARFERAAEVVGKSPPQHRAAVKPNPKPKAKRPKKTKVHENNPPRWDRRSAGWYEKETLYSNLRVEQDQRGRWRVYRDDFPMLENCKPATFFTCADAQGAADVHQLDCYPNAPHPIDDGFSWLLDPELDWRSLPDVGEARARCKQLASLSRP
jgi:hypothetical protein